ncbi:hypothetical protein OG474_30525 [Kribbella sp. NBC_01505]|uniref:phage terminase small subunit n=1 Tax=Kribbella sp. NBC_01505 TaxID=2903580 RepID=UPI00386E6BD1
MPGPVPNRSDDLARPRSRKGGDQQDLKRGTLKPVTVPHADKSWDPIAKRIWDGLKSSGQAEYFQNSDWAFAFSLMDDLSYYKRSGKRSGQMLQTIYTALERLLVTEADRRRLRIELHEPEPETQPASVTAIASYKAELGLDEASNQ